MKKVAVILLSMLMATASHAQHTSVFKQISPDNIKASASSELNVGST